MARLSWTLVLLARLWASGPGLAAEPVECFSGRPCMGTVLEVTVLARDRAKGQQLLEAAFAEADRLERVMSNWRGDSELSDFNRRGEGWRAVSEELGGVLHASRRLFDSTRGAFDVTLGPVILLTRDSGEAAVDPVRHRKVLEAVGGRGLLATRRYAALARAGMAIDLGGIGKGYAADRIVAMLGSRGALGGYLDFGRSSQVGFGPRGWRILLIGLDGRASETVELKEQSVSTSGSGLPDSTVLDPRTGRPVRDRRLVTVRAASGADAEGWSTALVVLGPPGLRLIPAGMDVYYRDATTTVHFPGGGGPAP